MRLRRLVLGLATAVIALGATEGLLRVAYRPNDLLFVYEEGHVPLKPPRPDADGTLRREDGPYPWSIQLNHQRLREVDEIAPVAPPDTRRLLAVGDSWIFGFGVDQGHTLPDELERLLSGRLAPRVEVINAGQPGGAALRLLDRARSALALAPDVTGVILGQPHNPDPGERVTVDVPASWIHRWLRHHLLPLTAGHPPRALDGEELAGTVRAWAAFAAELRAGDPARGIPPRDVWFLALPQDRESAIEQRYPPEREWVEGMAGVPVVGHALGQRSCWAFTDPYHPSEAGQRALAEVLAPVIAGAPPAPPWTAAPSCDDVPGVGPGKPYWAWEDP